MEIDKLQNKVDSVKRVMVENIDKILDRQERLALLHDRTDSLRSDANRFMISSRGVKEYYHKKKLVWVLGICLTIAVVLLAILLFAYRPH